MSTGITSTKDGVFIPWPNFFKLAFGGALIIIILIGIIVNVMVDSNDDKVKQASHDGSIDTRIAITHLNANADVLKTTHSVWVKNNLFKDIVSTDTIPSLGTTLEQGEDSQGNKAMLSVPKDYEVFITVQ